MQHTRFPLTDVHGDAIALVDDEHGLSWDEVGTAVAGLARHFLETCPEFDDRVAVTGENVAATLLAHAAGLASGVGTVAISRQLTAGEMADQLVDSGAKVLVTGPLGLAAAREAVRRVPATRALVVHGTDAGADSGADSSAREIAWREWTVTDDPTLPAQTRPARPMLVYTSGTTGRARASEVRWVLPRPESATALHEKLAGRASFPAGAHLVVGPLQHNGPLTALRHLVAGGTVVVMGRFDPERCLALIQRWRVASSVMVPTHFSRLLTLAPEVRAHYDVGSLTSVSHTGSACPADVKRAMIDWFGPVLVESYGGTELGTVARITSTEWLEHPGSVGRCVPGVEAVVLDEERRGLPAGEVGLLGFRVGPEREVSYHADPEKTASAYLAPGVVTLGDVGYVTEDGFVHITDRQADMVVSGGVNLYPAEAEGVLRTHPGVADVAVIGVPDPDLGEALLAKVVVRAPAPVADELVDYCRERLASYKIPRRFEFVDDLPRNAMGKLDKKLMRRPYWSDDRTIAG